MPVLFRLLLPASLRTDYIPLDTFMVNRERAIDFLKTRDHIYVFDGYAGVCDIHLVRTDTSYPFFVSGTRDTA